jgi:hypothetical protein
LKNGQDVRLYFTEEQYSYLLNIAEQCASEGNSGLSKEMILLTLLRLLQRLEVDMTGVKTEDELLKRLEDAVEAEILTDISKMT